MKLFLSICWMLVTHYVFSQSPSVSGRLIDSVSKQPIALATISVFNAGDTSLITFRMSDENGNFRIPNLPIEKQIRIIISYSGFKVYREEIILNASEKRSLGTIPMTPGSQLLDEVLVYAERPPVTVKNDTIEFNAVAFKTLPSALVEDLLKKLPGVQVDAGGNIMVNGRKVNRLLIDGKDFFGSDHKIATRNLPADIVDKVQVTDDKDEAELNPDRPKTELGQVVNLKLKKSIKQGLFGKGYAGGGTDKRYEAGAILNIFRDTLQLSMIGFSNNLDRAGFGIDDITTLGGFNRGGLDDYVINSRGVSVNNFSFGGQGEGINSTTGAGFNLNNVLKNGLILNSQYFYGQSKNDISEFNRRQQFTGDTILTTVLRRNEIQETFNHRIAFGLKGNINKSSRFEFRPSLVIRDQQSTSQRLYNTDENFKGPLNESRNDQKIEGKRITYDHMFIFFKSFSKKGRSLNISNSVNNDNGRNDQVNNSLTRYFDDGIISDSVMDQLRRRNANSFNTILNATYSEPLSKKLALRFNYSLNINSSTDEVSTFGRNISNGKYDDISQELSNEIKRVAWRNQLTPSLNFTSKNINASVNFSFQSLDITNRFGKQVAGFDQHYIYILPAANIRWKQLSFSYAVSANPPGVNDLQPVPDNSNPLFVNYGNIDLEPAFIHNARINFVKNNAQKLEYIRASLAGNYRNNAIIRMRTIRSDGVQETRPLNMDGLYNLNPSFGYSRQYKFNKNIQLTYNLNTDFGFSHSYLALNGNTGYTKTFSFWPELNTSLNWKDSYELTLGYSTRYGSTKYQIKEFQNLQTTTSTLSSEFIIRKIKHLVFETQIDQRYNSQSGPGIQKIVTLWNAAVTFLFLKNENGQLKFAAYDLLKQNINVSRSSAENYIQDRQINMLTQYFLVTFTYKNRSFKGAKTGGRQKFFMF